MRYLPLCLLATVFAVSCKEGPMGPPGPTGPQGQQGEQGIQGVQGTKGDQGQKGDKGDRGDTGITVVSGTSVVVPIGNGLYAASVLFPGVTVAKAVVGCWLRDPTSTTWFKVAFDFSGTGLDSCVASDSADGMLVSFITEKDHLWLGNILLVTVAYST